jgi:large conductance mechanosensitive channel
VKASWAEFKAFALGGNVLDLALGSITAFASVVEAGDVIMQFVAAIFGDEEVVEIATSQRVAE